MEVTGAYILTYPVTDAVRAVARGMKDFHPVFPAEGDDLQLFVKATILPDEEFKQSTGMTTRVLWSHYVPRRTETWSFEAGTWTRR